MEREELLKSKEYWLTKIQFDLFSMMDDYKSKHHINQTELGKILGVTKGYISQVMKGDYDHRISKMVELSLAFGKAPIIRFEDLSEYIKADEKKENSVTVLSDDTLTLKSINHDYDFSKQVEDGGNPVEIEYQHETLLNHLKAV